MPSLPVAGMPDGNQLPVAQAPLLTQQPDQAPASTNSASPSMLEHMINRLTGTGGEDRYQLWPEKVVRDALRAAHDAYNSKEPLTSQDLIKPAMDMSALAGSGGLAGVGETRLPTAALEKVNTNPLPKQFAKGTKDDTGIWFLEGNKPIYAQAQRSSLDHAYGADKAKEFDKFPSVTGKNEQGSPISVWYRPGEKDRALAEIENFKQKANATTDAEKAKLHYESGVNLGYPEEAARAYAYKRFGIDPNPAGEMTLGSAPFLRPALKYEGKIYKAPMGGQHLDAIPAEVYPKFQQMAMNGEDINHFNFGFMNHKGQFLDREKALDYAIKEGLLDPHSAQYGALTSTMETQ